MKIEKATSDYPLLEMLLWWPLLFLLETSLILTPLTRPSTAV